MANANNPIYCDVIDMFPVAVNVDLSKRLCFSIESMGI